MIQHLLISKVGDFTFKECTNVFGDELCLLRFITLDLD